MATCWLSSIVCTAPAHPSSPFKNIALGRETTHHSCWGHTEKRLEELYCVHEGEELHPSCASSNPLLFTKLDPALMHRNAQANATNCMICIIMCLCVCWKLRLSWFEEKRGTFMFPRVKIHPCRQPRKGKLISDFGKILTSVKPDWEESYFR